MALLMIALLAAQPADVPVAPPPPPIAQLPPQLTDPATADRLTDVMQALSQAVLDLRVGGVKAALDGRPASPAERRLTVRDLGRRHDPDFDRKLERRIAETRPMMRSSMRALATALPQMIGGLQQAGEAFDRALANMPDPTYPRR